MGTRASLNHVYRTVWNQALNAMVAVAETASGHGAGGALTSAAVRTFGFAPAALAVALAWSGMAAPAHANPTGGVAVAGQASMTSNGNQLLVTTQNAAGTNYSAINWQSFSIPAGSSTYFQQPSASSTSINRVVTSTPSLIFGTLGSNGNLVLVNQSGITVGAGAVVDTAGFTASALRMSDADAMAGRMRFGDAATAAGNVSVQGSVLARSGDVVVLAGHIDTGRDALIQAPNGNTILAAGQQIEITGRGLEGIALQVQAPADSVVNLGTLQGDAVGIFAGTLKHSGVIQAHAVTTEGGKVVLKAIDSLEVDGTVQAQALGQRGGSILASAKNVKLDGTALLDASGDLGGGEVLVGGGYQGHDARLVNSQTTDIAAGAQLKTDAITEGDGGTVVVWSDGATRYRGSLSARGGALGGNGGKAEVSGKQYLDFLGTVDLLANNGTSGNLLLDPTDWTIDSSGYGGTISAATIDNTLASVGSLTLQADNDISVNQSISYSSGYGAATLTLNAGHDIVLNADISSSAGALGLTATANNAIYLGQSSSVNLMTSGGNVNLTSTSGNISGYGGTIATGGGSVNMKANAGSININNNATSSLTTNGGNVTFNAGGNISATTINTTGASASAGVAGRGGDITVTSNGQIQLSSLTANGGSGTSGTVNGGAGGSISVSATNSSCDCGSGISTISAAGGSGYGAGVSGAAGAVSINVAQSFSQPSSITAASLSYSNTSGSIDLTNMSLSSVATLSLTAYGNITANTSGVNNFSASITGSGNVSYTNSGALTIGGIQVASGNITVDNTGAINTTGAITASSGNVNITAHSPITIGAGGITASGNVALTTATADSTSNITINGAIQSTGGNVNMAAYNNLVQNSYVYGAQGVAANTTAGALTFGPNGYSGGSPLNYSSAGTAVVPPLVPLSALTTTGGTVSDFLDQFLAAVNQQPTYSDDPFDPRNRSKDTLVVEGQVCTP